MEVRIVLAQLSPPVGTVSWRLRDGCASGAVAHMPFSGWLGLLAALERVIGVTRVDPPT